MNRDQLIDAAVSMPTIDQPRWWQRGVIYQIYPRSFMDSDGDGIGDLAGIISRLDYCRWLGMNAIWLSPIYPSPMADFGYDVSDYTNIDPMFGTLDDFDSLLFEAHRLNLKVLLDFVPNHTSEQHRWFLESRSSRSNPYRDWYIWRDAVPASGPPNNWRSVFGGSAWTWDEGTGQYYFHSYLKEQPDLNWRNPEVERAMFDVLRFWLDRGVDGLRVDAIARLIKDAQFPDNPPNPNYTSEHAPHKQLLELYSTDQLEIRQLIGRMRRVVDDYDDRVMIGEAYLPLERLLPYYAAGVHFPFNFQLLKLAWQAPLVSRSIDAYEGLLSSDQWPNWVLGNHDNQRVATRIGQVQARVAAMLLLTLRGTPIMYYGDEIGMQDVPIPADLIQDPWEKNVPGLGLGRDPERSPMQWNAEANAGFTNGTPWLPVAADFRQANVAITRSDPFSILTLYRRLIALRAQEPALHAGSYTPAYSSEQTMVYVRGASGKRFLVALNFSAKPSELDLQNAHGRLRLSTYLDREGDKLSSKLHLRAGEGLIVEVT